jgi:hypothetical protein
MLQEYFSVAVPPELQEIAGLLIPPSFNWNYGNIITYVND